MQDKSIYTVGGTVQAGSGLYIPRKADNELFKHCLNGEYAYVLTSRQMGKSSLMVRISEDLQKQDIGTVIIDLSEIGITDQSPERWYLEILVQIADELLQTDIQSSWKENSHLGVTTRFSTLLQEILKETNKQVVIFIDEIDTTLNLSFRDDFFALIRYFYNSRPINPILKNISFVLLGMATPNQLINDVSRTPFNIGKQVDLTDFTFREALLFADGLNLPKKESEEIIRCVVNWTGGHPYLTQKVCANIASEIEDIAKPLDIQPFVEKIVQESFFTEEQKQNDNNIKAIRDYLAENQDSRMLLGIYYQIRNGAQIIDDTRVYQYATLKLSGLIKSNDEKILRVRNPIYHKVFDIGWISTLVDQTPTFIKENTADVFISYSRRDEHWVVNSLLPRLEANGLRVVIDFRDFIPGYTSLYNIENAIMQCKFSLLILTPGWVASEWQIVENAVSRLSSASKTNRIIPIVLKNCKMPPFISMLTWVDFTKKKNESAAWEQLLTAIDVSYKLQTSAKDSKKIGDAHKDAEEKIQKAQRSKAKKLDLSSEWTSDSPKLAKIPESLLQLKWLQELDLSHNYLKTIPSWIGSLTQLRRLNLSYNELTTLPDELGQLTHLQSLILADNKLTSLPEWIGQLNLLEELSVTRNQLNILSQNLKYLVNLKDLRLSSAFAKEQPILFPDFIRQLIGLENLWLESLGLTSLPDWIGELKNLKTLLLSKNQLTNIPASIAGTQELEKLGLDDNPLNPELASAYTQKIDGIKAYLRATIESQVTLHEAKLFIMGEGEVGKTCLLDALQDNPWQEHESTHGIQIKLVKLTDPSTQQKIAINVWDFGGQRVYRPTHQLFFSAPAVYLVVWKPREGSQAGQVKEWIQLVKRREPSAKILVVATHGGPQQRQPDIDRQELWDLFGRETVVDFFFVDSKPDAQGQRKGIDELKRAIAQVAASLPEVGRSVPKSFADVRAALQETGKAYLPLREVLDICRAHKMDDEIARLFITISHRLGHLTHYENDPTLRDIVILRPDWLATAMSYVLDDEETRANHGLVNFSRLSHLWDDENRAADSRYEKNLHPIFLRLMERFDLSYRVADPTSRSDSDPVSLIGQLVPDIRPQNLSAAWESSPALGDIQQMQICHIVDSGNGQSASAEGLFYQLIVRLQKYSLGRADYKNSVHWQRGLVLEDEYKSRAFLEHVGNDVRITVRSPYPEGLLGMLTREVKFLVESFWEGLRCDIMVPCIEPCGKNNPGTGLFEVEKLMIFKRQGMSKFPCIVSGCNQIQDIDALLRNAPAAAQSISLTALQSEFTAIKDKLDEFNVTSRRVLSQVDKTYTDLLQVLTDEAKEGPRLFSLSPVNHSTFNPETWIREPFRLILWCEHSRLPLPVLNNGDMKRGVYDLELDREWFKKSAPYLKFLTGTLGMVLPVASSAVKLALDETAYKLIEEQLDFGKSIIDAAIGETSKIGDFLGVADSTTLEHGVEARADGSTLRELHALLKAKDPGFGGLVRVMNKRQEFLWVHEQFAGEY